MVVMTAVLVVLVVLLIAAGALYLRGKRSAATSGRATAIPAPEAPDAPAPATTETKADRQAAAFQAESGRFQRNGHGDLHASQEEAERP